MSKPEIQTTDDAQQNVRENLKNVAKIVAVHVVIPVALTAAAILVAKKLDAKSE